MKLTYRNSGFTLVEAIVAIVLMGIIATLVGVLISTTLNTIGEVSKRQELVLAGSSGARFLERELRMMASDTSLLIADDDQLKFEDRWGNTIEYTLTSGTLSRKVGAGTARILATPIVSANSSFHFYNSSNSEISTPIASQATRNTVRLMEMRLRMDAEESDVDFLVRVFPENLKVVRP